MTRRFNRRSHGFALVEVVISLALFALIIALLQATLFTGSQMLRAAGSRDSKAGDLMIANRILEQWIGSAVVDTTNGGGFTGSSGLMRFHALLGGEGRPALFQATLSITRDPAGGTALIAARRRLDDISASGERTILLNWNGPLEFRYAGAGDRSWSDDFIADGQLPSKVRLVATAGPLVTVRVSSEESLRCLVTADPETLQRRGCRVQ